MLVRVEVRNSRGALLSLPLDDDSSGLFVKEIGGLDPVKATLVSSSVAGVDGAQYHSSRRESRNPTFKMGVEPDWLDTTVADLRKRLYDFFMPKSLVDFRWVMHDGLVLISQGRVESFNFPLFVKDPEANLSIISYDPDFVDPTPVKISKMSVSNETEFEVKYEGTVEVGGLLTVRPDRVVNAFTLYHQRPDGKLRTFDFTIPLAAGDKLQVSTVTGAKGITLTRSGTESSALYGMTPESAWLELQQGTNRLRLYTVGAPIPFDLEFDTRYGGL